MIDEGQPEQITLTFEEFTEFLKIIGKSDRRYISMSEEDQEEEDGDCATCPDQAGCIEHVKFFKEQLIEINEKDPHEINLKIIESVDKFISEPTRENRKATAVLVKQAKAENRRELEEEKEELRKILKTVLSFNRPGGPAQ